MGLQIFALDRRGAPGEIMPYSRFLFIRPRGFSLFVRKIEADNLAQPSSLLSTRIVYHNSEGLAQTFIIL